MPTGPWRAPNYQVGSDRMNEQGLSLLVALMFLGIVLCLLAMISRRLRKLFLGRRLVALVAMIVFFAVAAPAVNRATELKLERLRQTDSEAYLNELHSLRGRDAEWLQALRDLHPDRYEAEIARRDTEERQRREQEARAAEEARRIAEARRQAEAASSPPPSVIATTAPQAPTGINAITTAGWEFQLSNDPMDRTALTQVLRRSGDSVEGFAGRLIYPTLAFRCEVAPGRSARWSTWLGFEDGTLSQVSGTAVRYRFDEGSVVRETWPVWADSKGLWTSNVQFITRASQARRLHIEWWPHLDNPRYASFDLSEVASAIRTVADACGARAPLGQSPARR